MTTAEIFNYAYDQIDHARAELNAVSRRHTRVSKLRVGIRHCEANSLSWGCSTAYP
jgi:hypothetical protein